MIKFDNDKYELIQEERIEELKSDGYLFRHRKSGARVLILANDDENKVFNIGFRTPPSDSTGVPHIMEHSVLWHYRTARGEEYDKLAGLEGGADDYVVKPFSPRELVARVKAVLNRTMPRAETSSATMTFGDLTIDTASHTVRVAGEDVALTPKEFDLLVFLASNKGIALSREKILQKVWNYDYFGEDRTVDTHVKMLRGHLGKCRSYIATVWGIGYKFDPDAVR